MSLIDQALKKTQSSLNQQQTTSTDTPAQKTSTTHMPFYASRITTRFEKKYILNGVIGITIAAIITLSGFEIDKHAAVIAERYTYFYGNIFSLSSTTPQKPTPAQSLTKPLPLASELIPEKSLVLTGTMEMEKERAALINGHLYHVGDRVADYQIKAVHYNQVVLSDPVTHHIKILTTELNQ